MNILEEFFPLRRHQIAPGSDRLVRLMRSPEGSAALMLRCVLVVGTNGKGSTSRMLEAELTRQDITVGTYSSPHFVDPLERIRIAARKADPELVKGAKETVQDWVKLNLPDATFFEITTAIALLCFYRAQVDLGVIEAGIGARFDSTNALAPLVTILTSVGLDHMNYLGPDEEVIAFDKSFGSRRNCPYVCGFLSAAALRGVRRALAITGAKYVASDPSWSGIGAPAAPDSDPLPPKLRNALTACSALDALQECLNFSRPFDQQEVVQRLSLLPLPGRFEVHPVSNLTAFEGFQGDIILDNGHNPSAIQALLREYEHSRFAGKKFNLVFGSLKEKDYARSLALLCAHAETVTLVQFEHQDSLTFQDMSQFTAVNRIVVQDIRHVLLQNFACNDLPHLVTGSFAFVGEVMKELQICPDISDSIVVR